MPGKVDYLAGPTPTTHSHHVQTADLLGIGGSSSSSTIPLVIQPDADAVDNDELPPSYESEGTGLLAHPSHHVPEGATNAVPNEPPPDFTPYVAEHHQDTKTGEVISYDRHLNEDGEALYRFLLTQNMSRPRPQVRMRGTHIERHHSHHSTNQGNRTETEQRTIVDFDVCMEFQSLILIEPGQQGIMQVVDEDTKTYRGGLFRTRGRSNKSLPVDTPIMHKDVRNWADDYCANPATCKEFVMEKISPGYDTKYIETRLIELIQSTNYGGDIQITFPTTHNKVKIRPANKLTELRYNQVVRWSCYLTFLWIITWPILWLMTKKYHVVRSVWPMSAVDINGRRRVRMTEDEWFQYWRLAIRRAILGRRQGQVTQQDLIEIATEAGLPRMPMNTGNQTMDNLLGGAADFFSTVTNGRRQTFGWGRSDSNWSFRWGRNHDHHHSHWDC